MKTGKKTSVKNICNVLGVIIFIIVLFALAVRTHTLFHLYSYLNETQGRSVASGKTAGKVLKNGRESPWDVTLNEPVVRLILMLDCD